VSTIFSPAAFEAAVRTSSELVCLTIAIAVRARPNVVRSLALVRLDEDRLLEDAYLGDHQ
jgi:hypothetical protein